MVAREIAVLEFAGGGSPLTPSERAEAAQAVRLGRQIDAQAWTKADADMEHFLQTLAHSNSAEISVKWLSFRLAVAKHEEPSPSLAPVAVIEDRIVKAHDPVLVFDPAHNWLITAHTVHVLAEALPAGARAIGVTPPGPDAEVLMTARVSAFFTKRTALELDDFTRAEQLLPAGVGFIHILSDKDRAQIRDQVRKQTDEGMRDLLSADQMVVSGHIVEQLGLYTQVNLIWWRNYELLEEKREATMMGRCTPSNYMKNYFQCNPVLIP